MSGSGPRQPNTIDRELRILEFFHQHPDLGAVTAKHICEATGIWYGDAMNQLRSMSGRDVVDAERKGMGTYWSRGTKFLDQLAHLRRDVAARVTEDTSEQEAELERTLLAMQRSLRVDQAFRDLRAGR